MTQTTPNPDLSSIVRQYPANPAMRVRAALVYVGESAASMARHLDRNQAHVSMVINGVRNSDTLRQAIADYLGVELTDIWPEPENQAA